MRIDVAERFVARHDASPRPISRVVQHAAFAVSIGACGVGPSEGDDSDVNEDTALTEANGDEDHDREDEDGSDDGGHSADSGPWDPGDDTIFDLGSGNDGDGPDDPDAPDVARTCGTNRCVDTTAEAAVLLEPCSEWFATFFPPFDESYECWSGAPRGHLVGDTDLTFAHDDPDLLLVGRWDGGIAQARVTRDANCNITGFVDAQWQPYEDDEPIVEGDDDPSRPFVRGMTWLDDGTMLLARRVTWHPQQVGQRAPGSALTEGLVDTTSLLPPWDELFYGGEDIIVGMTVVPPGFPGAGTVKVLAEKLDTSHWFSLPLAPNGGTYDFGMAVEETTIHPPEDDWGGYYARGIAWVGDDNPDVDVPSVLVPEAWHYTVALYELDTAGNPLPQTRTPFVEGLGMPSGAETDSISGNNFVFTGRRSQDVYVVRGCDDAPPPPSSPRG